MNNAQEPTAAVQQWYHISKCPSKPINHVCVNFQIDRHISNILYMSDAITPYFRKKPSSFYSAVYWVPPRPLQNGLFRSDAVVDCLAGF